MILVILFLKITLTKVIALTFKCVRRDAVEEEVTRSINSRMHAQCAHANYLHKQYFLLWFYHRRELVLAIRVTFDGVSKRLDKNRFPFDLTADGNKINKMNICDSV